MKKRATYKQALRNAERASNALAEAVGDMIHHRGSNERLLSMLELSVWWEEAFRNARKKP